MPPERPSSGMLMIRAVRPILREVMLMLMALVIVLLILWALGAFAFHIAGGLIHLLLVVAIIVLIYRLVTGRRPVA